MALFVIVGPVGSGKRTLVSAARELLKNVPSYTFCPCWTTSATEAAKSTMYDVLPEKAFLAKKEAGELLLYWKLERDFFGIPLTVKDLLKQGSRVVVLASSQIVGDLQKLLDVPLKVVVVSAPRAVIHKRLAKTGVSESTIDKRLKRDSSHELKGDHVHSIVNDKGVEAGIEALLAVFDSIPTITDAHSSSSSSSSSSLPVSSSSASSSLSSLSLSSTPAVSSSSSSDQKQHSSSGPLQWPSLIVGGPQQNLDVSSVPPAQYLSATVFPVLNAGLDLCDRLRPRDPVDFLALFMLRQCGPLGGTGQTRAQSEMLQRAQQLLPSFAAAAPANTAAPTADRPDSATVVQAVPGPAAQSVAAADAAAPPQPTSGEESQAAASAVPKFVLGRV